jgi:putative spermidine/putrescine transport system permease protein
MSSATSITSATSVNRSTAKNAISDWMGLIPFFVFVFIFLIYPSLNLFMGAFKDAQGNFTLANINFLKDTYVLKSYSTSLQLSIISSIVGGALGFFAAYAITIGNAPRWMRSTLITFSALAANFGGVPLAFSFIATVGRTGFITALLNQICFTNSAGVQTCPFRPYDHGFNLYSMAGLVLAYTYFLFPLMILTMTPALDSMKKEWREASSNLGASSSQYWRDIGLPILWPSILGSLLLLFGSAFGAFATAQALTGGSIDLVTILIGQQIRGDVLNNPNEGYALALGMVVVMAITIVGYTILQRRTTRWLRS